MTDAPKEGTGRRARRMVRAALPAVSVDGPKELAALLDDNRGLLLDQAVIQLGHRPEAEELVEQFIADMKARERVRRDQALQWVMQRFRERCYRARVRLDSAGGDELTERERSEFEGLTRAEREAMLLSAEQGLSPAEIGRRLHLSPKAIRMRLYRARRHLAQIRERAQHLPAWLLVYRQQWRWRRRRIVSCAPNWPGAERMLQLATGFLAISSLGSGLPSTGLPAATRPAAATALVESVHRWPGDTAAKLPAAQGSETPATTHASAGSTALATLPPGATPALLVGHTAASEPPDDAQILDVAPAPTFPRTHQVVALGVGRTCACYVLYRSEDGGATWTGRAAPVGAEQVVLPRTYPNDSRIFVGSPATGTAPDYVLAAFDSAPMPLPGPPGDIALAAGFDAGDDRVFVAARSVVWSFDTVASQPHVQLRYPGAATPALIATATGESGEAILAAVPTSPPSAVPGGLSDPSGMYACATTTAGGCVLRSSAPSDLQGMTTAGFGETDATVVTRRPGGMGASLDGARTFHTLPAAGAEGSPTAMSTAGGRLWTLFAGADHRPHVAWMDVSADAWHDVTTSDPALARAVEVVAVSHEIVIVLLVNGAMRCTTDGGTTWSGRCTDG